MKIKGIIAEDFINYKLPSMVIEFPFCDFKCDKECGRAVCQNSSLAQSPVYDIPVRNIVNFYMKNDITQAIVFQGLEPFDSFEDMLSLISSLRIYTQDPIVVYTGYKEDEIQDKIYLLIPFKNIVIKYGRFIPDTESCYDPILGVRLASNNQYAKQIC